MNKKVLIILILCGAGLFLDDLSMHVARFEYNVRDLSWQRNKVARLEQKTARIPALEARLKEAEDKVGLINYLSARLNLTRIRLNLVESFLRETVYSEHKIKIFRTTQSDNSLRDVTIGSYPSHQREDWGRQLFLVLGSMGAESINRVLMKFQQITPGLLKGKKILAAVIYLRHTELVDTHEDDSGWNETINLYEVLKKWNAGNDVYGEVTKGETCWLAARWQEERWDAPGCGGKNRDYDPEILATTGPFVSGGEGVWMPIVFTEKGLNRLQNRMNGGTDLKEGFLLENAQEGKLKTLFAFDSSESIVPANRPYMEIYYLDQ